MRCGRPYTALNYFEFPSKVPFCIANLCKRCRRKIANQRVGDSRAKITPDVRHFLSRNVFDVHSDNLDRLLQLKFVTSRGYSRRSLIKEICDLIFIMQAQCRSQMSRVLGDA